jgi:hypothetical protein
MLTSWTGWIILVALLATTYVQLVGKQVELLSGADRLKHLDAYRYLFGGPPWVQWAMFRWGGFVHIIGAAVSLWRFGWRATLMLTVGLVIFGILSRRIARGHAMQMLVDLEKTKHHLLNGLVIALLGTESIFFAASLKRSHASGPSIISGVAVGFMSSGYHVAFCLSGRGSEYGFLCCPDSFCAAAILRSFRPDGLRR